VGRCGAVRCDAAVPRRPMDRFTATAHFPQKKPGKTKLVQSVETGLPVFARDTDESGKKSFFSSGYAYFCTKLYAKPSMRNTYEVLQFGLPTKVYFDFDHYVSKESDPAAALDKFDNFMNQFLEHVVEDMSRRFELDPDQIPCVILDASTASKLSRHVIFQVALPSVEAVGRYCATLINSFPAREEASAIVDDKVYTRNRSFRLIYSTKKGKSNPLLPYGRTDSEATYDPRQVFQSLIQAVPPPSFECPKLAPRGTGADPVTSWWRLPNIRIFELGAGHGGCGPVRRKRHRSAKDEANNGDAVEYLDVNNDLPPALCAYVSHIGGAIRSGTQRGDFMSLIVGGVFCPWRQKVHKSNNAFLTINTRTWTSWFRCADDDCPKAPFLRTSLNWVME